MPNKQAGKKALRQTKRHVVQNTLRRDAFKEAVKNVIKAKTKADALKLVSAAQKALDKAAKIGVIKKNTASRRLSRLMAKIHAMETKAAKKK
jgi:small subunit ribosomal protein S20